MRTLCLLLVILIFSISIFNSCKQSEKIQTLQNKELKQKDINIKFWTLSSRAKHAKSIIDDFTVENPHIKVELIVKSSSDFKNYLKAAASSETLPDAWFNWGGSLGSHYPENGYTVDLTSYAEKNKWKDRFLKSSLEMCTFNGQLSGMPTSINMGGIIYNKQIFKKFDISEPVTMMELETAMKKLKENGIIPISMAGMEGWLLLRITQSLIENYAGEHLHNDLLGLKASWNNPAVISMYARLKEWSDNGYFPKDFVTMNPDITKSEIFSGKAAMVFELASWDNKVIEYNQDVNNFGFFHFPTNDNKTRILSFVEMIQFNKKSSQTSQEAAIKFAEFFYGDNMIDKHLSLYKHPLPIKGAKLPPELVNVPEFVEELENNGSFLIGDQALPQEIVNKFFQTQEEVVVGSMTPEQAAKFMDDEIIKYKATIK